MEVFIMQTIKLQLDDSMYQHILKSGVDIQAKFKEFLIDFIDDDYPSITTEEAKKRVLDAVESYNNGTMDTRALDDEFWNDTEKRLIQRHKN